MADYLEFDKYLITLPVMELKTPSEPNKIPIMFQFAPLIKNDSKGGNWNELPTRAAEPIPFFEGGTPRVIDLRWTYIVTDEAISGSIKWDAHTIASYVRSLRGYFYNAIGSQLIIFFSYPPWVGEPGETWTWRSDGVDISHSENLVKSSDGNVYPLRTDVSMKLKFYTKELFVYDSLGRGPSTTFGGDSVQQVKIDLLKPLPGASNKAWF